jgi:RHS repeat-associated protein
MTVPNRHNSGNSYRYGFQGQEKDNELKGDGNSLNYTFRMHDPRVGRFFAVDPLTKKYPYLTPYQFSSNQPVHAQELEGLESSNELGGNYAYDNTDLMFNMMFGWFGDARAGFKNMMYEAVDLDKRFVGNGTFGTYEINKKDAPSNGKNIFDLSLGIVSARFGISSGSVFTVKTSPVVIKTVEKSLVRFGDELETVEGLATQAKAAEKAGFGHGVSVKEVDKVKGSDLKHKSNTFSKVQEVIKVVKTGKNKNHYTVELPKPVTIESTKVFNDTFKIPKKLEYKN